MNLFTIATVILYMRCHPEPADEPLGDCAGLFWGLFSVLFLLATFGVQALLLLPLPLG